MKQLKLNFISYSIGILNFLCLSVCFKQGGTAVDAVEKAVCFLEDNPNFNAGHGAVLNVKGEVECDAMIMDGSSMDTG